MTGGIKDGHRNPGKVGVGGEVSKNRAWLKDRVVIYFKDNGCVASTAELFENFDCSLEDLVAVLKDLRSKGAISPQQVPSIPFDPGERNDSRGDLARVLARVDEIVNEKVKRCEACMACKDPIDGCPWTWIGKIRGLIGKIQC